MVHACVCSIFPWKLNNFNNITCWITFQSLDVSLSGMDAKSCLLTAYSSVYQGVVYWQHPALCTKELFTDSLLHCLPQSLLTAYSTVYQRVVYWQPTPLFTTELFIGSTLHCLPQSCLLAAPSTVYYRVVYWQHPPLFTTELFTGSPVRHTLQGQINEINTTSKMNRINNRLIDLCKFGPGLILINRTLSLVHRSVLILLILLIHH